MATNIYNEYIYCMMRYIILFIVWEDILKILFILFLHNIYYFTHFNLFLTATDVREYIIWTLLIVTNHNSSKEDTYVYNPTFTFYVFFRLVTQYVCYKQRYHSIKNKPDIDKIK